MARLPNTATAAEIAEVHAAKMAGKAIDRLRMRDRLTHFRDLGLGRSALMRMFAIGSIAKTNRHTGEAHEHKREIARRARQAEMKAGNHPWRGRYADPVFCDVDGGAEV